MDTVKLCALSLLVTLILVVVKQWNPSFELPLKLAVTLLFSSLLFGMAMPLIRYCKRLIEGSAAASHMGLLMAALGVAVLSETAGAICRECKEATVASYIETAGRLEILVLCLPLVEEILGAVRGLMAL